MRSAQLDLRAKLASFGARKPDSVNSTSAVIGHILALQAIGKIKEVVSRCTVI